MTFVEKICYLVKKLIYSRKKTIKISENDEKATVIIPIYNGFEHFTKLTKSLLKNTSNKTKIIIIDDCSTDDRIMNLLNTFKDYKNIKIIKNEVNLGYAKSVNKGINLVKTKYAILLNSDTIVPRNWVNKLLIPLIKYPRAASSTPFSNSASIFSFPNFNQDNYMVASLEHINEAFEHISNFNARLNRTLTGHSFCLAINMECVREIGLFDENVFAKGNYEENDWCFRALSKGWNNYLCVNLYVYHNHCESFNPVDKQQLNAQNFKILHGRYTQYLDIDYPRFISKDLWRMYRELAIDYLKKMKKDIVCYTCITGNYDNLKEIKKPSFDIDYICFIDNNKLTSSTWKLMPLPIDLNIYSNVKKQRLLKILPHKYLPNYDISIWIDGSIEVNCDLLNDFLFLYDLSATPIFTNKHPLRDCLFDEVDAVLSFRFDKIENINSQIIRYKKQGFPHHYGLYETNIIIRKHNDMDCIHVMNDWAYEIICGSHRDQLSFTYCLWKNNVKIKCIKEHYSDGDPLFNPHRFIWHYNHNRK